MQRQMHQLVLKAYLESTGRSLDFPTDQLKLGVFRKTFQVLLVSIPVARELTGFDAKSTPSTYLA